MEFKRMVGTSYSLGVAHFKLRNEGSYFGIVWYLLNPFLMFVLLLSVFSKSLGSDVDNYPLYLLLGIVMFNFFQAVTVESTKVIRRDRGVIRSIPFPHESLIGSIVIVALFSHFFEIIVMLVFLLIYDLSLIGLLFYPLIIILFSLFSLGLSLILSSIAVYFVDLDNLWSFGTKLLWLATPIIWSMTDSTPRVIHLMNLINPLYYFITLSRHIIVYHELPPLWIGIGTLGFTALSLILGSVTFRMISKKFAEMV